MHKTLAKAVAVGVLSTLASLLFSFTFVPMMGGEVSGAGLVMTIACPFAISVPISLVLFHQAEKLRGTNRALQRARDDLGRAYALLQRQSRQDTLTGVLNRTTFLAELQAASGRGMHGGLLFLDIDHFKSINDRFGHAMGDEALRRMGALLAGLAAGPNTAGRLGGEEFAIFLPDATPEQMLAHSRVLCTAVARIELRTPCDARVSLAASIGAYHCPPGFDPAEALAAADRNLYRAKSMGRNRVVA